jgi:hypothetical protein
MIAVLTLTVMEMGAPRVQGAAPPKMAANSPLMRRDRRALSGPNFRQEKKFAGITPQTLAVGGTKPRTQHFSMRTRAPKGACHGLC